MEGRGKSKVLGAPSAPGPHLDHIAVKGNVQRHGLTHALKVLRCGVWVLVGVTVESKSTRKGSVQSGSTPRSRSKGRGLLPTRTFCESGWSPAWHPSGTQTSQCRPSIAPAGSPTGTLRKRIKHRSSDWMSACFTTHAVTTRPIR